MPPTAERTRLLTHARSILDSAKNAGRDLNDGEAAEVETTISKIKALDAKPKGDSIVSRVMALGSSDDLDAEGQPRCTTGTRTVTSMDRIFMLGRNSWGPTPRLLTMPTSQRHEWPWSRWRCS